MEFKSIVEKIIKWGIDRDTAECIAQDILCDEDDYYDEDDEEEPDVAFVNYGNSVNEIYEIQVKPCEAYKTMQELEKTYPIVFLSSK